MLISETPLNIKNLRRRPPPFQVTFCTPLNDLKKFAELLLDAGTATGANALIDQEVFEPKNVIDCLERHSIAAEKRRDVLVASNSTEAKALLEALLGDWLDFVFLPQPRSFVLYADHDEYTTIFAHKRRILTSLTERLLGSGYTKVEYVRPLLGIGRAKPAV